MSSKTLDCMFVSDLHGHLGRYNALFQAVRDRRPSALFFGGDLLPSGLGSIVESHTSGEGFIKGYLAPEILKLREQIKTDFPEIYLLLGNDDGLAEESEVVEFEREGLWQYSHLKTAQLNEFVIFGYSFIPPSPFILKDLEKYDVSRYVDPGCISPEEGFHTSQPNSEYLKFSTISADLKQLSEGYSLERSVFLFHTPPYKTKLDRADLDHKSVDSVPMDVHIGSIAVRRFIEESQPYLTLHGHVHESARLTGSWKDSIGRTQMYSAAHDGPELALVSFDLFNLKGATRELLPASS